MPEPSFKRAVTRGDWILFGILLTLTALIFMRSCAFRSHKKYVWITAKDKTVGYYPLNQDRIVKVQGPLGTTVIQIQGGQASIIQAPCPHKFCQKMGPIPSHGRIMVCIPNRIIVEIKGKGGNKTDAVTR